MDAQVKPAGAAGCPEGFHKQIVFILILWGNSFDDQPVTWAAFKGAVQIQRQAKTVISRAEIC